jgi:hypothetical protein
VGRPELGRCLRRPVQRPARAPLRGAAEGQSAAIAQIGGGGFVVTDGARHVPAHGGQRGEDALR